MKKKYTDGKRFAKGSKYDGDWKNGEPHGIGIMDFSNGAKYEGYWKDGKFHGKGVFSYSNGIIHDGEFEEGEFAYGYEYRPTTKQTSKKEYFNRLNIPESATKKDIKKAYRKLAKKYHPDINKTKGTEKRFRDIMEAYQILYEEEDVGTHKKQFKDPIMIDHRKRIRDNKIARDREREYQNRKYKEKYRENTWFAICADCGKECELLFKPDGVRPVYCNDCLKTRRKKAEKKKQEGRRKPYRQNQKENHEEETCRHCGNYVKSYGKFCGSCGKRIIRYKTTTRKEGVYIGDVVKILIVIGGTSILVGILILL